MFIFWFYLFGFVCVVIVSIIYIRASSDEEDIIESVQKFKICVLINGDDEDCEFESSPPYAIIFLLNFFGFFIPIITFLTFGARKELILFWKEYFMYVFKEKKIPLQFVPSFDPSSTSSVTINSSEEEDKPKMIEKLLARIKEI